MGYPVKKKKPCQEACGDVEGIRILLDFRRELLLGEVLVGELLSSGSLSKNRFGGRAGSLPAKKRIDNVSRSLSNLSKTIYMKKVRPTSEFD